MQSIYPNLDKMMIDHGMSYSELGSRIGLGNLAMYRRLKGITNWRLPEILAICDYFNEPNAVELFTIRY